MRHLLTLVIVAAAACGGGGATIDAGGDGAIDAGVPTDCAGLLAGDCGTCLTGACCAELLACGESWNCMACLGGLDHAHGCTQDPLVAAVSECAQASCAGSCLTAERTARATCDAPVIAPSSGACIAIGGAITCNPVTNEGCNTGAGESCDVSWEGFECYPSPGMYDRCQACGGGEGGGCGAGLTCFGGLGNVVARCARWCCDDGDCGSGRCDHALAPPGAAAIGICVGGRYVDDSLTPDAACHSPPMTRPACFDCCKSEHASGLAVYDATIRDCACATGGGCTAVCGAWCATGAPADLGTSCSACLNGGFADGTCARERCFDTPVCRGFLSCLAAGCSH